MLDGMAAMLRDGGLLHSTSMPPTTLFPGLGEVARYSWRCQLEKARGSPYDEPWRQLGLGNRWPNFDDRVTPSGIWRLNDRREPNRPLLSECPS